MRALYPFLIISAVVLSVAFVVWLGRRPVPAPIRVVLLGTTNDSSGVIWYRFQATNAAERGFKISYQTQVLLPGGTSERSAMSQRSLFVFDELLPGHASREFAFPTPEEAISSWRVLLFYDYPMPRWRSQLNRLGKAMGLSQRIVNDVAEQKVHSERISRE